MRIVQITERFYPHIGGVESHVLSLARVLQKKEIESVVVTRNQQKADGGACGSTSQVRGIAVVQIRGIRDLRRALDQLRPALVHLHGARAKLTAEAGLLCRALKLPYVVTPHCFYPPRNAFDRARKAFYDWSLLSGILRRAGSVICLTDVDRRDAVQRGARLDRTCTLPNAVDLDAFAVSIETDAPDCWDRRYRHILSVGRLDPIKRFDWLIEAFEQSAPEDCRLIIAGPDGGDAQRLRGIVETRGLAGRVHLAGVVNDARLRWMYSHCTLFVLASAFEGLPTVVLEAMGQGAPVLASDAGGTATLIRDRVNGFLFRSSEREDLTRCLKHLLSADIPASIAHTAREEVLARYNWGVVGDAMRSLYASVLSELSDTH